jgi:hypothetical protein
MVAADRDNHPQATANEVDPPCGFLRTCLAVGAHLRVYSILRRVCDVSGEVGVDMEATARLC